MEKFEKGQTVKLKSGGPVMTVESVNVDEVTCVWFEQAKLCSTKFDANTLTDFKRDSNIF